MEKYQVMPDLTPVEYEELKADIAARGVMAPFSLEYDHGKAVAIVEYKNEHAAPQYASHPTYQAMIDLGDRAEIPVLACRYADDFSQWDVVPLNRNAKEILPERKRMTEPDWVRFLYSLCGYTCPDAVIEGIYTEI